MGGAGHNEAVEWTLKNKPIPFICSPGQENKQQPQNMMREKVGINPNPTLDPAANT